LTNNYGLAILIFAVAASAVMFPVGILAHKNSIRLLQIQPKLTNLKRFYSGDKERLNEEQYNLFKEQRYSPLIGLIPLFIRLFLIIGILQVMYHPLQHVLRFEPDVINAMVSAHREVTGIYGGVGEQLQVLETLQQPQNLSTYQSALADFPNAAYFIQTAANTNLYFLRLNIGEMPSLTNPSIALIVPLLAVLSALAFCLVQSKVSPGALSQGRRTNWSFTIATVGLSLYFALATPVGVGLYWTAGNLLGMISVFILNRLYNPKKLAGEALAQIEAARKSPEQLREEKQINKELSRWEKEDATRFCAAKKHLVFYALTSGQYKYYKNIVEHLLEHPYIIIHYLTNDPNDALFTQHHERLIPYYASQKKTISLMMKLDCDMMITTVPDLHSFHMKRSIVRDDIEYIYIPHGLTSTFLTIKETAYDHYDTIFCVGSHQVSEIRRREEMAGLPRKNLVKAGYGVYDQLLDLYASISCISNEKPWILIAPSWQADNIMELCIDDMLKSLLGKGYNIAIRPHPQYSQMFPKRISDLEERYSQHVANGEIKFELDFLDNESIFQSDVLITDWSSIAFEFSYCTLKPSIFINTPMKIMNPNYELYGLEAIEISFRDKIGISVDIDNAKSLDKAVAQLMKEKNVYKEQIEYIVHKYLYYPGRNGEAGSKYILNALDKNLFNRKEISYAR